MCLFTKKPETNENSEKMQNENSVDQNRQENMRTTSAASTNATFSTVCTTNTTTTASNEVVTLKVKAKVCIISNSVSSAAAKSNLSDDKGKPKKLASLNCVSSFKLSAKSTSTVKADNFPIPEARMANRVDAKGFMPEKPSTSSPTLSFLSPNAKKKLKPARVYIFNNEKFDTESDDRVGSAKDVEALRKTFEHLKCIVEVINNATLATIRSTVQKLKSKNFIKRSALVIVILTHGDRHDKLAAKDSEYSLDDDMIFPILHNQTLYNKPKLVFVQACKGAMTFKTDAVPLHGRPNEIYKCYSTYEGYVSYRTVDGTPFIQTLCEALQKSGQTKDIDAIMMDVRIAVEKNHYQIPSVTSTLTTKYVFGDYM